MGGESVLPYLSPQLKSENLLNGANFASAGIGILNDTGSQFVSLLLLFIYSEWVQIFFYFCIIFQKIKMLGNDLIINSFVCS